MADRTGYSGNRRPYPTSTAWDALGSPTHIEETLLNGNIKHRDLWKETGVEITWEEDKQGNLIHGSFHTKIQRNKHQSKEIFGKKYGIDGPITFAD